MTDFTNRVLTLALTGSALDWAVSQIEGPVADAYGTVLPQQPRYSADPATTYRVILREGIATAPQMVVGTTESGVAVVHLTGKWLAKRDYDPHLCRWRQEAEGKDPLEAAMRCFVFSRVGQISVIPKELL